MSSHFQRLIEVYEKRSEQFVREYVLPDMSKESLQKIWGAAPHDPDYFEMRRIDVEKAPDFQELVKVSFDFDRYLYYYAVRTP